MKNFEKLFTLVVLMVTLKSCLVPPSPRYHHFVSTSIIEKTDPRVMIFSTPMYKYYDVTDVDMNAQVFISSPVFDNPDEFFLMTNQNSSTKQYKLKKKDGKFYRTTAYTYLTLKIVDGNAESTIKYRIADK